MSPSIWQIAIVVIIALIFIRPKKIPELGSSIGKAIKGFKKGISADEEIDVTNSQNAKSEQIKDKDKV